MISCILVSPEGESLPLDYVFGFISLESLRLVDLDWLDSFVTEGLTTVVLMV